MLSRSCAECQRNGPSKSIQVYTLKCALIWNQSLEVTAKSLRTRTGEILACVDRGESVVITYRGKPRAKLVGIEQIDHPKKMPREIAGFGMWKDREDLQDVDAFVQGLRYPRDAD